MTMCKDVVGAGTPGCTNPVTVGVQWEQDGTLYEHQMCDACCALLRRGIDPYDREGRFGGPTMVVATWPVTPPVTPPGPTEGQG